MEREFLGWEQMPLEGAAAWLFERFGAAMDGVLVALPGARSGRLLGERLARLAGPRLRPPRVVTAGLASDELLQVEGRPAGRLVRTLAWKRALAELDPAELSQIVARAPEPGDWAAWTRLAEEVRALFGEVAAEGLAFADVASSDLLGRLDAEGERRRWRALAAAQRRMAALVERAGFVDPHLARLRAIDAGRTRAVRAVVLVGVSEMNALLRRALDLCEAPASALVFAPAERADAFDAFGALIPEAWASWRTSLEAEPGAGLQWFVVDGPAEQARQAARVIAGWGGRYAAEQISIGLADREVAPHLEALMRERGVAARDAAGTPMARTRPAVLLSAVARFAQGRRFADWAALVRHPDFEAAVRRVDAGLEPADALDRYHGEHLPARVDGRWLADPDDARDRALAAEMARLWRAARSLLGELLGEREQPLTAIVPRIRQLLQHVYADRALDPGSEPDRVLIAALSRFGRALGELESLPADFAPAGDAAAAIQLLLRSTAGDPVPPAAQRAGEPTLEMLGWLELALDDAPALVVTGFEDGRVPESVHGDAYLPNALRCSLGLVDNPRRLARDLYAAELLLRSRERVAFVSGRRSAAGDPQVPSRIVFHCDESDLVPRVERFLAGSQPSAPRVSASPGRARALPRLDDAEPVESIPVTGFARFLASPYLFYLERVAGLKTRDDRDRELDALRFGSLAHDVLQRFGEDEEAREERDAEGIRRFLEETLERLARQRYGGRPLPAVRLQVRQLGHRLGVFAVRQAERRQTGWRIREVEWSPARGYFELPVDDAPIRLTGKIDRIDFQADEGRWAIWDYKTGENVRSPVTTHRRRDGSWRDLQLPLYCVLAQELLGDEEPAEVGYIALPRDAGKIRFDGVDCWARSKDTGEDFGEGVASALEAAREVVRRIRRGEFFVEDGFASADPIFGAIAGVGVITGGEDE